MPDTASKRPAHVTAPPTLPPSPPVPAPRPMEPLVEPDGGPPRTRYGDWEKNGIAVDF